jgi:hypothetical protein
MLGHHRPDPPAGSGDNGDLSAEGRYSFLQHSGAIIAPKF